MDSKLEAQLMQALAEARQGNKRDTTAIYDIAQLLQDIKQNDALNLANQNLGKVDASVKANTASTKAAIEALTTVLERCETILANVNQRLQDANIKYDQMLVKQQAANDKLDQLIAK